MSRNSSNPRVWLFVTVISLSGITSIAADGLDERITLDLKEVTLQKVFEIYRVFLDAELDIDSALDDKITFAFDNITVRTSLNAICESAGCRWELIEGQPRLLKVDRYHREAGDNVETRSGGAPNVDIYINDTAESGKYTLDSEVTIELNDADITSALQLVAKIIGSRLLMDLNLDGDRITVNVTGVPLSMLLDTICEELGCQWQLTGEDPETLEVSLP